MTTINDRYSRDGGHLSPPVTTSQFALSGAYPHAQSQPSLSDFGDKRIERKDQGLVKFKLERTAPDFGVAGWRAKGNMLKNQQYYRVFGRYNMWDDPVHCGRDTWKTYHGPRLRTDAGLMEQRDKADKREIDRVILKNFVNESRQETLARFYQRKFSGMHFEQASSWSLPHIPRRNNDCHADTSEGIHAKDLNALVKPALNKILTPCCVQRDIDACKFITEKHDRDLYYEKMQKDWEQYRQAGIREDFSQRQQYLGDLQMSAGQPGKAHDVSSHRITDASKFCTKRTLTLSQPHFHQEPDEVTVKCSYRGLVHADVPYALETLTDGEYRVPPSLVRDPLFFPKKFKPSHHHIWGHREEQTEHPPRIPKPVSPRDGSCTYPKLITACNGARSQLWGGSAFEEPYSSEVKEETASMEKLPQQSQQHFRARSAAKYPSSKKKALEDTLEDISKFETTSLRPREVSPMWNFYQAPPVPISVI